MTADTRAVLFDMDGLLLDTERLAMAAFCTATAPFGLAKADATAICLDLVGSSGVQTRARVAELFPEDDAHLRILSNWDKAFHAAVEADLPVKAGVYDVVTGLAARGRSMAVVTSTRTEPARDHLRRVGLLDAFVTVVGSDSVEAHKPDPAPYLAGASAVGRPPEDCVAFEDSDKGVASAVAAGCVVWQVPDLRPPARPFPDLGQSTAKTLAAAISEAGL